MKKSNTNGRGKTLFPCRVLLWCKRKREAEGLPQDMKEENNMSEVKNVTITVPVGLNGWQQTGSVVINGMKVEFPVGEETQVPETAAALLKELIEEAEKRAEDTAKPNNHYVGAVTIPAGKHLTLEEGAGIKRADKVILPETALTGVEDDGSLMFSLRFPWAVDLTAGIIHTVKYNGTGYECKAVTYSELYPDAGAPEGTLALGNFSLNGIEGVEGSNPDAPFVLLTYTNAVGAEEGGMYGALMSNDGATSVTLSIVEKGEAVSVGGGVVFVTGTFDPNGGGDETNMYLIPDKSLEECKALVEAGNYLVFKIDGGDAMGQMYAPLCEVTDVMRFSSASTTGSVVVTLRPDDNPPQCVITVNNFA